MNNIFMSLILVFLLSLLGCSNTGVYYNSHSSTLSNHSTQPEVQNTQQQNAEWVLEEGIVIGLQIDGRFYQMPDTESQSNVQHYF